MARGQTKSSTPPPLLEAFAARVVGAPLTARDLSWEEGRTPVWLVRGARGCGVLKPHGHGRKFAQELAAYREWLPRLGGGVPKLLDARTAPPRALLLELLPGRPLATLRPGRAAEASWHREAGRLLARLHALPIEDRDPLPLAAAFGQRLERWGSRAERALGGAAAARARERALEAIPALAKATRVPCHRDFTPRNWLVSPAQAGLAAIDFEHARQDHWLVDLERLWRDCWPQRPDLRNAFLEGYGRELEAADEELLERLAALGALGTVAWAHEHSDPASLEQGRAALARLGLLS